MGVLIPLACLWACFSLPLPAEADPSAERGTERTAAYLELVAPDGCASRQELIERVRRRSARIRFAAREQAEKTVFAEIRPLAGRAFDAMFTFVQVSGRLSQRHVQAKTCDEALDALALLITLALDAETDEKPQVVPASLEPAPADVSAVPAPAPSALPAPSPSPVPAPSPSAPAAAEPALTVAAGVGGLAAWGPSPEVMPGAFLYAAGSWPSHGVWSPALRLSAIHAARGGYTAPGGTADFALDILGLDVCPLGVSPAGLTLRACATGVLGQLSSSGSDAPAPQTLHRPFAAVGGSLLLMFEPSPHWELLASLGASVPLIRDSFHFRLEEVFFHVRPVTMTAGLGLGFRLL
jgi:hypothetical protein